MEAYKYFSGTGYCRRNVEIGTYFDFYESTFHIRRFLHAHMTDINYLTGINYPNRSFHFNYQAAIQVTTPDFFANLALKDIRIVFRRRSDKHV